MYPRLTVLALLAALPQVFAEDPSSSEESSEESSDESSVEDVSTEDVSAEDVTTLEATPTEGATPEAETPAFIAPNPTPVSTTQDTTAFVYTAKFLCNGCSGQFDNDCNPSVQIVEALSTSLAHSQNVGTGDTSVAMMTASSCATRMVADNITSIIAIAQENMTNDVRSALLMLTKDSFLTNKTAIMNLLPDGSTFSVTSLTVDEITDSTSVSSSVQTGSALSFLCGLLWLIK